MSQRLPDDFRYEPGISSITIFSQTFNDYSRENDGNTFLWGSSLTRMDQLYFSDMDGAFRRGDRSKVRMMGIVALVLLLCAILNYINLTVAPTGKRAKEMATRRLLGENNSGIMLRYLSEAALLRRLSRREMC